jgi:small acid-soluble spore protein D (minor alpha/beta-type SASP)
LRIIAAAQQWSNPAASVIARSYQFKINFPPHTNSVTKLNSKVTKCKRRKKIMASRSSNKTAVPEAKGAMNKFKYEVASELGVPLTDGYNGDLTSKQNGSVGGYMVKKMIEQQEKQMAEK